MVSKAAGIVADEETYSASFEFSRDFSMRIFFFWNGSKSGVDVDLGFGRL